MPLYTWKCPMCDVEIEVLRKYEDRDVVPEERCPIHSRAEIFRKGGENVLAGRGYQFKAILSSGEKRAGVKGSRRKE
jgi:predicted nucleic acid-binding Zn ribbon protein